ncbi:MAG: hypothetical protein IIW48_11400 [Clostridia bacterium]|nr:hypothetical protein [Clostridia bacterium]
MSEAKKCDRCGTLYEIGKNCRQQSICSYYIWRNNGLFRDDKVIDLCNCCQEELIKWLEERGKINDARTDNSSAEKLKK